MKNIVGTAKIKRKGSNQSVHCYLSAKFRRLLNCEFIVIDARKLIIKRASIDNQKSYSIKASLFGFTPKGEDVDSFVGEYNIKQVDEDTFILKRIKNV